MSDPAPRAVALIVIAKEPRAGRSKTRLCPPLEPGEAAALAEAALADTLEAVRAAPACRRVLALDGRPGRWLPPGFQVVPQIEGGLDARIAAAFDAVGGPALLVGMDTPQLTAGVLEGAASELMREGVDAVLGPAEDGGYWSLGLRRPRAEVFAGVPMSSPITAIAQRRRLRELGFRWSELEQMRDVDEIDDARAVADLCPDSAFARAYAALRCAVAA
jgi:uncharacterized protein